MLGESDGRKFVQIEPDARHVELIVKVVRVVEITNAA